MKEIINEEKECVESDFYLRDRIYTGIVTRVIITPEKLPLKRIEKREDGKNVYWQYLRKIVFEKEQDNGNDLRLVRGVSPYSYAIYDPILGYDECVPEKNDVVITYIRACDQLLKFLGFDEELGAIEVKKAAKILLSSNTKLTVAKHEVELPSNNEPFLDPIFTSAVNSQAVAFSDFAHLDLPTKAGREEKILAKVNGLNFK